MVLTAPRSVAIPLPRPGGPGAPTGGAVQPPRARVAPLGVARTAAARPAPLAVAEARVLELRCLYAAVGGVAATAAAGGAALVAAGPLSAALVYWAVALLALAGLLEQGQRHPGLWRRRRAQPAPGPATEPRPTLRDPLAA